MGERNILVECYGDTLLAKQMKYDYFPFHSGVGEVANTMKKNFSNRKAIAIIDNDKNQPSYFTRECNTIKSVNGIILMKHKEFDHYVIKISPALEDFINSCAKDKNLELFEKDKKRFREITKDSKLHSNTKFVNYLNKLIAKNPAGINTIKEFIKEINAPIVKVVAKKKGEKK